MPQKRTKGFIYVMASPHVPGLVKVGRSVSPDARLVAMKTGCPGLAIVYVSVEVTDAALTERLAHKILDGCRVEGEWFKVKHAVAVRAVQHAVAGNRVRMALSRDAQLAQPDSELVREVKRIRAAKRMARLVKP